MAQFAVVQLNGALVLFAAVDSLHLFFALNLFADLWRGDGDGNENQGSQKEQADQ